MKYRIFTTSIKAWAGMLGDIEKAKKSIYFQMYILGRDTAGNDFFKVLEEAARRGVRVIAILDIFGSMMVDSDKVKALREAGAEVVYASFWFQRMHRKVLIVDESVAYTGGVNIARRFTVWKDLMIRVTGPVVAHMIRSFARTYHSCGGKDELFQKSIKIETNGKKGEVRFIEHGQGKRRSMFRTYYEARMRKAKSSIVLVTPYFFPPRWFIASMHQAIIRGVQIDILLPGAADHPFANGVNRAYASFLTELGAKLYFSPGMNHAKAMLIDGREGVIGSQNLDVLSFNVNLEAGVFFDDPKMVADLLRIIEQWKKEAKPFDGTGIKFRWYDIPVAFLLRLLGFIPV